MSTLNFDKWQNRAGTEEFFKCRAFVNFNGTGTVAIRASGNVSSITDNGTGDYTVNFENDMPDANYSVGFITGDLSQRNTARLRASASPLSSSSFRVQATDAAQNTTLDFTYCCFQVFR